MNGLGLNIAVDPTQHAWWLASRASGVVALALLTASVLIGLSIGGRFAQHVPKKLRPGLRAEPRLLTRAHEQTAVAALIAIGLHGVTLLGDNWLRPSLTDIALPFAMDYRPVYTGLGIIGGYIALALGLSYYFRQRIGVARWKRVHRFVIAGWGLSVLHTLGAGTDAAEGWLFWPVAVSSGAVALLFLARMHEVGMRRKQPAPAKTPGSTPPAPLRTGEGLGVTAGG